MEPSRFDDLTKALATATSRRQALKTIAATTLGGILGLSGIGTAFGKNKTCAQFCSAVFGANTPAAEQCTSDAAHGKGLCQKCGSATPPSSICCTRNSSGYCSSYSSAHCPCASGQTCQNGQCVSTCPSLPDCNDTCPCDASQCQTCQGGTCVSSCDACSTCQGGTCVSPCSSGQVCLSNGTCATPCTTPCSSNGGSCTCGSCLCDRNFCGTNESGDFCDPVSGDNQCPKGTFCDQGACFNAC